MSARGQRPATILDVAAAAGVSRQTVTRAVHDMPGIAAGTRERVLAATRALGYRPSRHGRGLVGAAPPVLGVLVHDLTNPHYPETAAALLRAAVASGWNAVIAERDPGPHGGERALARLATQVDALVSVSSAPVPHAGLLGEGLADLPLVEVTGELRSPDGSPDDPRDGPPGGRRGLVELDRAAAVRDGVAHLLARGARSPVVVDAPGPRSAPPSARAQELLAAFARAGAPARRVVAATADPAGGEAATAALLGAHPGTDAVVAFNDLVALGVLRGLRRAGVDVPSAVRVAGIDGLGVGDLVTPRLTTLALDAAEVARAALEVVTELAPPPGGTVRPGGGEPGSARLARRAVAHRLLVRESS